jgi:hypothetical protein
LFTLVVKNFGNKWVIKDDVHCLIASIKKDYALIKDWTGALYCGIQLEWNYVDRTVDTLMLGYIKKNCKNMGMLCPKDCKHVLTHRSQRNLELKPKPPSPLTHPEI